jgi:hypothetical protein
MTSVDLPSPSAGEDAASRWIEDHPGELAALLGFALMIAKVLRVAGDDPSTALGVVSTTGILAVVAGIVAAGLSDLLLAVVPTLIIVMSTRLYSRRRSMSPVAQVLIFVLLVVYLFQVRPVGTTLVALYVSWAVLLSGIVFLLYCVTLWVRDDQERTAPPRSVPSWLKSLGALLMLAFLAIGLIRFVNQEMWLPTERIQVKEAEERRTYVAYVLNADERWTTLLNDQPRSIFRVPSAMVEERIICRQTEAAAPTLGARLLGSADAGRSYLPPCRPQSPIES